MPINIFEFEVSDYANDGVAVIPLSSFENNNDFDLTLVSPTSVKKISIDFAASSPKEILVNLLNIKADSVCTIAINTKGKILKVNNLSLHNIQLDQTSSNIHAQELSIIGYSIDSFIPLAQIIKIETILNKNIPKLKSLIKAVNMLPGSGEFVYDTSLRGFSFDGTADSVESLIQLKGQCPGVEWISPIVTWFGLGGNAASCKIMPGVEYRDSIKDKRIAWHVGSYDRSNAHEISKSLVEDPITKQLESRPNYGGTVNDSSVLGYLSVMKEMGYKVAFYPMIFLDIPEKPWRGHISGRIQDIEGFFEGPTGYNKFILHYANLVRGKVDAFIIGSELRDLTKISDGRGNFPAVKQFVKLATKVKEILGPEVIITYAADWSEYHHTDGGYHHLDELWACEAIDVIGIDAYFPLTSRAKGEVTEEEIKRGWLSGEGYDYYIDWQGNHQPLGPDWAWKNLRHWWESEHWDPGGVKTPWRPKMKDIWFTEFGIPSINYATNQPNVFYDPRSRDGGVPKHSSGTTDFEIQKLALRASLEILEEEFDFVKNKFIWSWDARPFPFYPERLDHWSDGVLWEKGHWICGKLYDKGSVTLRGDVKAKSITISNAGRLLNKGLIEAETVKIDAMLAKLEHIHSRDSIFCDISDEIRLYGDIKTRSLNINSSGKIYMLTSGTEVNSLNIIAEKLNLVSGPASSIKEIKLFVFDKLQIRDQEEGVSALIKGYRDHNPLQATTLFAKAKNLILGPRLKLEFSNEIILDILENIESLKELQEAFWSEHRGEKTIITHKKFIPFAASLSAPTVFVSAGNIHFEGAKINAQRLGIRADNLVLNSFISTYVSEERFRGSSHWLTGASSSSTSISYQEIANQPILEADEIYLEITRELKATGAIIKAKKFEGRANSYEFLPLELHYSSSFSSKLRELAGFGAYSKKNINETSAKLFGASLVSEGRCYIFAQDEIYLEASQVVGKEVVARADNLISLKSGTEVFTRDFSVSSSGIKFNFNCRAGELSVGASVYLNKRKETSLAEFPIFSALIGESSLVLETNDLIQEGAVIAGDDVRISVRNWQATGPVTRYFDRLLMDSSQVGLKIGFQESISGAYKSASRVAGAASGASDGLSILNAGSRVYEAFRAGTNVAAGNGVSGGAWVDASHSHMEAESSGVTAHSNKVLAGRLDARIGSLEATGLDIEGSEHNIEIGRAEFRAISDIARNEVANSRIEGTIGLAGSIASSEGLSGGVSESEVISRRYNHIKSENLNITGSRVSGAVQIDSEVLRIDLDELSLRTVQGESLSSNSGFGIAVDHKASAISDFVRAADVRVGSFESRVTREMGGIAASSGVIEVRDLELIGSVIIKKPASSEELDVRAGSSNEEAVVDFVESRGFGAGFSSPAAGSSFGTEVRVSASGVDMSRVVGAGAVLGGSFEVGSEGFVGSSYDLEVSWADIVDGAAVEEAWSGGVSGISGRVAESVAVASGDVVDAGTKLVQIGSSILELPVDIVDALMGSPVSSKDRGVEESKGVEAEDAALAACVAAGDELSDEEDDEEWDEWDDEFLDELYADVVDSNGYTYEEVEGDREKFEDVWFMMKLNAYEAIVRKLSRILSGEAKKYAEKVADKFAELALNGKEDQRSFREVSYEAILESMRAEHGVVGTEINLFGQNLELATKKMDRWITVSLPDFAIVSRAMISGGASMLGDKLPESVKSGLGNVLRAVDEFGMERAGRGGAYLAEGAVEAAALLVGGKAVGLAGELAIGAKAAMKAEGGVAIALNEFDKHPSTFVGHKGKEIKILHGTNESAVIDGILYSGHALDRMQQRGFTPSVVKHIIETGERSLAKHGRVKIYSHENNMSIILEGNKIVTIRFSK